MPVMDSAVENLAKEIQQGREESDRFFDILKPEAIFERPIAERHRVIFYIGHLDGFDSIQICREGLGLKSPDPQLDQLFQAGIDPDAEHLPQDTAADWPSLEKVREYVTRCRERVDDNLERAPEDVIIMALEHRQMHHETLTYMFHNFPYSLKQRPKDYLTPTPATGTLKSEWREIPAGTAVLGRKYDRTFGWDNEFGEMVKQVSSFRIQRFNVTNGEYLEFVKAGAKAPHFWIRQGNDLYLRGMFELIPLPMDWPVYVTQEEAAAYAKWIGKALPTEEQFHLAAYGTPDGGQRSYPWGEAEPTHQHGNFDFKLWDPEPVTATPAGDSSFGVSQLIGNGWEWTSSIFAPFAGFKPRASYPGYSANFFDGEHNVIKGGSPRTASRLLRSSFRNWFRRDYPYVYATFRCVESLGA
jgi:iron(II)-dependent oxidoreductase